MSDDKDEAKRKILARRASFVAAALASVACQKEPLDKPHVCLKVAVVDRDADPPPQPCLAVPFITAPVDAAADIVIDAGADTGATKDASVAKAKPKPEASPRPCLSPPPNRSSPQVCLFARLPKDDEP